MKIVLVNETDWFFNLNHLFLIVFVALVIVSCLAMFHAKSENGKRATKIFFACLLFVLEIGRIIYKFSMHVHNGGSAKDFNWWWNISFQMCAIMTWTTIFTLIFSACVKKENVFLQFLYNILFGCAMVGGILTFSYPDCLKGSYPFLHFINIQTVLVHSLLIFVPLYFIKINEFKVEIKNIWKALAGYTFVGSIAMTASVLSGNNFAFSLEFGLFDLPVPFPWHLPIVLCIVFAVAAVLYAAFEIARLLKRKIRHETLPEKQKSDVSAPARVAYITGNICAILFGTIIMLVTAQAIGNPVETGKTTMAGLMCLFGLVYMICMLIFSKKNKEYLCGDVTVNKTKSIVIIVLTMLFALPLGIIDLTAFMKATGTTEQKEVR